MSHAYVRPSTAALVVGLLLCVPTIWRPRPLYAGVYGPGWNLVSGPDGSLLIGATRSLYTLQPGADAYTALPPSTQLVGGVGYWAYFPQGGSVLTVPGAESYVVPVVPNTWMMIGNPSSRMPVAVLGADRVLSYDTDGYHDTAGIAVGQGAWVLAQADVTLVGSLTVPIRPSRLAPPSPPAPPGRPLGGSASHRWNTSSAAQARVLSRGDHADFEPKVMPADRVRFPSVAALLAVFPGRVLRSPARTAPRGHEC